MNPVAFFKLIFAFFTLLAFVFPMIIVSEMVSPWESAHSELSQLHPNEFYLVLESASENRLKAYDGTIHPAYKMKSYLVLPSNKTYRFYLEEGKSMEASIIPNFTLTYILINLTLILLFVFGGLPILKDWRNGKLIVRQA